MATQASSSFALLVEGTTQTNVNAQGEAYEYMVYMQIDMLVRGDKATLRLAMSRVSCWVVMHEYSKFSFHDEKSLAHANSLKLEGNELYASSKYEEALERHADALEILSEDQTTNEIRAICYSNRAICFLQLQKFKEAVTETSKALEINPTYVKALLRRAHAQEKLDNLDEALSDMKKVLELDPGNKQARDAVRQLEPRAAEKREKLKEEMIGKLKDLGNNVLGRFGMSLDNFKTVQDPNTGSYSISFQR